MKALLFINGTPPANLPNLEDYDVIACSDGAFHYLKEKNFPFEKLDFVSGDFDSHDGYDEMIKQAQYNKFQIIHTPDQNKTDFQKALEILLQKGVKEVHVFGGSGGEMDHFLGNLTVNFSFKNLLNIRFFDDFSEYYFIPKNLVLENVKNKLISLYPFPKAENVTATGLNWEIKNTTLEMQHGLWTRNFAKDDKVSITYESGDLLLFIGKRF